MKSSISKKIFQPIANFKLTIESSLPETIVKIFTLDSNRSYRLWFWLLIGIVVSFSLVLTNIGIPPINALPTDVSILLESGWRTINGQTPHLDYYSPLGILTSLGIAFGMKISSPSASSIAYGNVLFLVILTPWAWFIARSRFSAFNAFLFSLFMGLLLVAPRPLGSPMSETTYAMLYNRQGYVLLSMLLAEIFVLPRISVKPQNWFLEGLSSGILLALLFYSKFNYFAIATVAILLHVLCFRFSKAWLIGLVSGLFGILASMYIVFNLNLFAYFADISLAAQSQNKIQKLHNIKGAFIDNFYWLYLIFILLIVNPIRQNKSSSDSSDVWHQTRPQIIASFVALSGVLICGTNSQATDIPLLFVSGLILLEHLRRKFQVSNHSINSFSGLKYFFSILITTLFCVTILLQDLGSVTAAVMSSKSKPNSILQSKNLSDLVVVEHSSDYPPMINDGLNLLRRYTSKDSRVLAMDFANPFSFALELPPPTGDALWWHYFHTFNQESFPEAKRVFQEANLVIIPKQSDEGSSASEYMQKIYKNYLNTHFIKQDSSQFWTLWSKID